MAVRRRVSWPLRFLEHGVSTTPEDARNPARPSLANTLSGGDRSALGLAFFVAVAEHDPRISDTILVFDDPFHSQDRSRRRRTIECVHRLPAAPRPAVFYSLPRIRLCERIGSHGWRAGQHLHSRRHERSFALRGQEPPTTALAVCAYEQDYARLSAYLRNPTELADQLKDVARCIRQSLEGYMPTKFPESWKPDDWIGGMIGKIR